MAKKSKIVREKKLIKSVEKYATVRAELKALIKNSETSYDDREAAGATLASDDVFVFESRSVMGSK